MNNQIKTLVLAAIAAAATATTAYAGQSLAGVYNQGDVLAGFTSGAGTDLILNLGLQSSLAGGQSWDLTALLGSSLPANLGNLATVQFGVVADSSGPNMVYSTAPGSSLPNHVANNTAFNNVDSSLGILGNLLSGISGFGTPAWTSLGQSSWYGNSIGGGTGTLKANYGNPNGLVGANTVDYYSVAQGSAGARTLLNTWTLSISGGDEILTYGSAVPEPATYGVLAGIGLLALSLRRQFVRA